MGKIEKFISLIILIILLILLAVLFKRLYTPKEVASTYEVAVIMDNSSEEYWKYLMLGAEKAGIDSNVDLRFVGMYIDMKEEEQLSYIEREIQNNVDAIPIISIGGKIDSEKVIKHISADNYIMGERLAEALALEDSLETSYIFYPHGAVGDVMERYKGLINKIEELEIAYEVIYLNSGVLEPGIVYAASIGSSGSVIGLTPGITELLSASFGEVRSVYGVGITDNILKGLEKGTIKKVIAQSDYDSGYLSINWIYSYLDGKKEDEVFL